MTPRTRQELAALLDARMNRTYETLRADQTVEKKASLVKSYMLEAHTSDGADFERSFGLLNDLAEKSPLETKPKISKTDDPSLVRMNAASRHGEVELYMDYSNPRYWIAHSTSPSNALDDVLRKTVASSTELDRVWLPADFLGHLTTMGNFRGLGLDFDRRRVVDDPEADPDESDSVSFLKMQLWGNKAARVLDVLSAQGAFPHETTLSKISLKYWANTEDREQFAIDDVKFTGKVTVRGTSFDSHLNFITYILRRYGAVVGHIEENFSMRAEGGGENSHVAGEPIDFTLGREIIDLETFCRSMFSASDPFRLWGTPVAVSDALVRVRAVDLHIGRPVNFEIRPRSIRAYLPAGTCGNSVMRLYTNLQHHFDSMVQALSASRTRGVVEL